MYLEQLPHDVIFAMPENAWIQAAWNAAVENLATGKTKLIDFNSDKWIVSCEKFEDIAAITNNSELLYNLRKLDSIRKLPYIRSILAIPNNLSEKQARAHRTFYDTTRARSALLPSRDLELQILPLLRQIHPEKMPAHLWIQLAWKIACGSSLAEYSRVYKVQNGIWFIICQNHETLQTLQNDERIPRFIRWLSRYQPLDFRGLNLALTQ